MSVNRYAWHKCFYCFFIVLLTRIFLRPLPSCLISVHQGDQRWKKCVKWGSGPLWGAGDQKEAWRESRLEPDFHDPPEIVSAQRRRLWPPWLPGQWNGLYSSDVAASLLNDIKAFLLYGSEVPSIVENDPVSDVHFGYNGLQQPFDSHRCSVDNCRSRFNCVPFSKCRKSCAKENLKPYAFFCRYPVWGFQALVLL